MNILEGLFKINNLDAYKEFGAFLTEDAPGSYTNYSALLTPPKMKPYVAVDFREENGEKLPETLPNPAFEARDVTLYFAIVADDAQKFVTQYMRFISLLKSGWLSIYLKELDKTYTMYYKESSAYEQLTPIEGKMAARFKVIFREPKPVF